MACSKIGHTCGCSGGCNGCSGTCTCSGGCSCGSGCTCGSNCSGTCSSTCSGGCKATCADNCENTCTSACKNFKRYSGGSWIGVSNLHKAARAIHETDTAKVRNHIWKYDSSSNNPDRGHYVTASVAVCSVLELAMTDFAYVRYRNNDTAYNYVGHCVVISNITQVNPNKDIRFSEFAIEVLKYGQTVYNPNYGTLKEHFYKSTEGYSHYFNLNGTLKSAGLGVYGTIDTREKHSEITITKVNVQKNGSWVGLGYKE